MLLYLNLLQLVTHICCNSINILSNILYCIAYCIIFRYIKIYVYARMLHIHGFYIIYYKLNFILLKHNAIKLKVNKDAVLGL